MDFQKTRLKRLSFLRGAGCEVCNGTGYKGRVAIHEVLEMSPALRDLVLKHPSSDELKRLAIKEGFKTLRMSAFIKAAKGLTTLDEVLMNSGSDKL